MCVDHPGNDERAAEVNLCHLAALSSSSSGSIGDVSSSRQHLFVAANHQHPTVLDGKGR